jgi:hypothetical protein
MKTRKQKPAKIKSEHFSRFTFSDQNTKLEHSFGLNLDVDIETLHNKAIEFCEQKNLETEYGVHDCSGRDHEYGWTSYEIDADRYPELMKLWRQWFINEFGPSSVTTEIETKPDEIYNE